MKYRTIILWILIVLVTLGVGLGGLFKLIKLPMFVENAKALNYSADFSQFIGLMEIIGCIGLYLSLFRVWAALGLIIILIGAIGVSVGAEAGIAHHLGPVIPMLICTGIVTLDKNYKIKRLS